MPMPTRRRITLRKSLGAYLILLALLWLGETVIGERFWGTTLLTYAPQLWFCLPAPLFLLLALRVRTLSLLARCGAMVLLCLALLGWNGWHRTGPPPARTLRVLQWNIRHGESGGEKLAAQIRAWHPDIVFLEEARPNPGEPDPFPALLKALPEFHGTRAIEVAVLSRQPLEDVQVLRYPDRRLGRVALEARTDGVRIVCAHLATAADGTSLNRRRWWQLPAYLEHTAAIRQEQTQTLLACADRAPGPFLLAGDFNTPPRGRLYQSVTRSLTDSFAQVGSGFGFTFALNRLSRWRIDYIFSRDLTPLRSDVLPRHGLSDHDALLTIFALPG